MATKEQLANYFDVQKTYFDFLSEKLGSGFKEKPAMVLTNGSYHSAWDYLSTLDDRCKLRKICLKLMKCKCVNVEFRNGGAYMRGVIFVGWFPEMQVLKYLNDDEYGRRKINSKIKIWNCNEVIKAW